MKDSKKPVRPIPDGFHTVTPFLNVNGAAGLIEFIKKAFDGKVTSMVPGEEEGKVMHATMSIGDSTVMISDATEKYAPMPSMLHLYVEDIDAVYKKALDAKAETIRVPTDEFYGDRSAGVTDAWGNQWWIATHVEDVSEEEMQKRVEEFQKSEA